MAAMASPEDVAAAFDRVDALLVAATAAAPAVALLLARAAENGVSETKLTNHLRLNSTTARWVMKLAPDATTDRIDLDEADLGELVLRWARS